MAMPDITIILAASTALGPAASSLVDASKAFRGGISNAGFGFIREAVAPFRPALELIDEKAPLAILVGNWINGMAKPEQKSIAKNLVRLGLTSATAEAIAKGLPSVDGGRLAEVARLIETGGKLEEAHLALLGRFDAIVDARLDAAFEKADQKYRNSARVAASIVALALAGVGATVLEGGLAANFVTALFAGLIATPIAPVAKDLTSALATAVNAFKAAKS